MDIGDYTPQQAAKARRILLLITTAIHVDRALDAPAIRERMMAAGNEVPELRKEF